jgi:hypothetical protein
MNSAREIIRKPIAKIAEIIRRRKAESIKKMERAKRWQESSERSMRSIANFIAEGDFENAEKVAGNISLSRHDIRTAAIRALVPVMVYCDFHKVKAIAKRYPVEEEELCYAATSAYDKCMNLGYYENAIRIAKGFGLVDCEKAPAMMLVVRNLKHGLKDEAREIAKKYGVEKELGEILESMAENKAT